MGKGVLNASIVPQSSDGVGDLLSELSVLTGQVPQHVPERLVGLCDLRLRLAMLDQICRAANQLLKFGRFHVRGNDETKGCK